MVSSFRRADKFLSSVTRWPRRALISCICLRRMPIWWCRWGSGTCLGVEKPGSFEGVDSGGWGPGEAAGIGSGTADFWGAGFKVGDAVELEGPAFWGKRHILSEWSLTLALTSYSWSIFLVFWKWLQQTAEDSLMVKIGIWSLATSVWKSLVMRLHHYRAIDISQFLLYQGRT